MRKLLLLTLIGSIVFLSACNRCPKDEKLGTLGISDTSKSFMPYANGQTLIFADDSGNQLTFEVPNRGWDDDRRLIVDVPCSKGSYLTPDEQHVYYDAESFSLYAVSEEDDQFTLLYNLFIMPVEDLPGNDTLLVEYLEATAQFDTHVANSYQVTSTRGNAEVTPAQVTELENIRFVGDTTLLDKTFENVYTNLKISADSSFIYYNQAKGIVGVKTPDKMWVLQD